MIVKKFEAETVGQALSEVKREMGEEAIILHTKTYRKGLLLGLRGKQMVEVTASCDKIPSSGARWSARLLKNKVTAEAPPPQVPSIDLALLQKELNEIKGIVGDLAKRVKHSQAAHLSDEFLQLYHALLEQDVSDLLAQKILEGVQSAAQQEGLVRPGEIESTLEKLFMDLLNRTAPIQLGEGRACKVVLVGPTGVGKTTTLAKLAAHFLIRENKDVALITMDTYRIAAVEQLRTYADIMHVPIEVVLTASDLKRAIEQHAHRDLILMDTAGRSQKNALQMLELANLLEVAVPDETHLVLSLAAQRKNTLDVIEQYRPLKFDRIILSKLDEAVSLGLVLDIACAMDKGFSYVTHGQNVPEDMDVFRPEVFAKALAKGERVGRSSLAVAAAH